MTTDKNNGDHPQGSDPGTSSDDDKLEQLAARFLALWREQVAATADGADAASAIGRLYASLGADTTRMGEGFEAWGKLIGQMAMGQQGVPQNANPLAGAFGEAVGKSNPLRAMMDQMAKAARDLPTAPFPSAMPFPPRMAAGDGQTGMGRGGGSGGGSGRAKMQSSSASPSSPSSSSPSSPSGAKTDQMAGAKAGKAAENADGTADNKTAATSPDGASQKTKAAHKTAKGQGKNDQSRQTKAASAKKTKPETGGATAAADAYGRRDDELAQLARRIADLSETIAALEAGTQGPGAKPPSGD